MIHIFNAAQKLLTNCGVVQSCHYSTCIPITAVESAVSSHFIDCPFKVGIYFVYPGDIAQTRSSLMGGPSSLETRDTARTLIKASPSLWSQQSFNNEAQTTEKSPMLRGLPHSFEETAVLLSSFHHIKDPCLYFLVCSGFMLRGAAAEEGPHSGHIVFVNILRLLFGVCIYFFSSALWSLKKKPRLSLEAPHFFLFCVFKRKTRVASFFCLYAWKDLLTCIKFSLFIQLALCFALPCFIHESDILWQQLHGGFPRARGTFELKATHKFTKRCKYWNNSSWIYLTDLV